MSHVALSVRLSVCALDTRVSRAKTAEPIEMSFGGPRNHILNEGVQISSRTKTRHFKWKFSFLLGRGQLTGGKVGPPPHIPPLTSQVLDPPCVAQNSSQIYATDASLWHAIVLSCMDLRYARRMVENAIVNKYRLTAIVRQSHFNTPRLFVAPFVMIPL